MSEVVFEHPKIRRTARRLRRLMYTEESPKEYIMKGIRMFENVLKDPELHKHLEQEFGIKDHATRTATLALKLLGDLHEYLQRDISKEALLTEGAYVPPLFSNLSVNATSTILDALRKNPDVKDIPKLLAKLQMLRRLVRDSLYIGETQRRIVLLNLQLAYNLVKARSGDITAKANLERRLLTEARKLRDFLIRVSKTKRSEIARTAAINRYILIYHVAKLAGINTREHAETFRRIVGKHPEEFLR